MQDKLLSISESNEEMLTYFNKLYSEHEKQLKESKDRLFEINIKLDELTRTESIYSLNNDMRKNVFSPITIKTPENEREAEIQAEVKELSKQREEYEYTISEESIYLKGIDKRIQKLTKARSAIDELLLLSEEGRIKIIDLDSSFEDDYEDILPSKTTKKRTSKKTKNSSDNIMRSDVDITNINDVLDNGSSNESLTRFESLDDGIKHLKESATTKSRAKRSTKKIK